MTFLYDRVRSFEKANEALSKRRRAKRIRIQVGGALIIEDAQLLIAKKENIKEKLGEKLAEGRGSETKLTISQHCKRCGKAGHNTRIYEEIEEVISEEE